MNRVTKKILSVLLSVIMVFSLLPGCGKKTIESNASEIAENETINETGIIVSEQVEVDTEEIVETIGDEITYSISTDWEDYIGDVETFVYGLMINQLSYKYDVFPACVELLDGLSVSGIAYTDYEECFVNEDETVVCFSVGFIPNIGELTIPEEDFNSGLIVENLEYQDKSTQFILKYQSNEFENHCVVYGQYVTYGVNAEGQMFYTSEEYMRGYCNENLGPLYSFDESRYVYDIDVGEYAYISGESLATQMDFDSLEEEINKILETQDTNFATVEVETSVYFAQEVVTNYLLSLQEETFLGYDVKSLVETASALDPMECYRITSDGLMTIDLEHATEEEVAQWLVGSACIISIAVGLVGSVVCIECPALSGSASALAGTAIEIFMQVVISDQKASDIEWSKVAIAACSGAVSGFIGPYITATTGGASAFLIDSALDGLIGGVEQTLYAWMDGSAGKDIAKSFGYGFALGFGLSAGFKGVSGLVGKLVQKLSPTFSNVSETIFPKLYGKVSDFAENVSYKIYAMKRVVDSTVFHSKYISNKLTLKLLRNSLKNIDEFIDGDKSFEAVLEDYAKVYADKVNSNQIWAWDDAIPGGENLTKGQRSRIKQKAVDAGLIPNIKVTKVEGLKYGYADFESAGVVKATEKLPENMWKMSDAEQFNWLDKKIGGTVEGYTWHHTENPGVMQLVPTGIHNVTAHNGGRTTGMWADALR